MSNETPAKWNNELIDRLRLLLLGQLVEITGVAWFINYDVCRWDIKFDCHFGFGRHEVLSIDFGLEKASAHIENQMSNQAWLIAKTYWKRKGKDEIREPG